VGAGRIASATDFKEDYMNSPFDLDNPPTTDQLHPFVYRALVFLAVWFVVAAWILFSWGGYIELDLGIVTVLVFMLIAIPSALQLIRRTSRPSGAAQGGDRSFRDWISGDFDTSQGRRRSTSASLEILLPMAAAAVGLTAIGVVFDLTATGSSRFW
jgi:hypothetical protein